MTIPVLSPGALLRAWEHVRENHGCAGADGVTVDRFADSVEAELSALASLVAGGTYRPLPLLPITILKKPGSAGTRRLLVPAVRDRVLQTAVGRHLGQALEDEFLDSSFAYRPHRSVQSALARIRYLHNHGYKYIATADIDSFFDRIDHGLLRQRLEARVNDAVVCELLTAWIEGFVWDGHEVQRIRSGIPQGSPISPLLANFFLSDLDLALEEAGLKFIRYADDFLVLSRERADSARGLEIARSRVDELHLRLKDEKTVIGSFEEGFHFLGAFFLQEDIWVPWDRHHQYHRVVAVPRPMPRSLVEKWLEPKPMTAMAEAFRKARHRPVALHETRSGEDDAMAYLYLTEQGSVLRKIGNRLVVEKGGDILLDEPYHKLQAVLVFGNVQITTQAMAELLDDGISVSLLSREGSLRGSLDPPQGKNVLVRLAQFDLHRDGEKTMAMARRAVDAKLSNAAAVLADFGDRKRIRDAKAHAALERIETARKSVAAATTVESLDGIEGAAAHAYFDALMDRNKSVFVWPGRVRHPATDPINALLSFGYTLVTNELASFIETVGLDSYVGCLHQIDYGRRSLALDLVEPFRAPLVDRLVLTVLNRRQFGPEDFDRASTGGMYLQPASIRRFLAEYEQWMLHGPVRGREGGFRDAIRDAVRSYAAALMAADPAQYAPFQFAAGPGAEES